MELSPLLAENTFTPAGETGVWGVDFDMGFGRDLLGGGCKRGFGAVKLCGVVEPLAKVPLNDKLLFEVFFVSHC